MVEWRHKLGDCGCEDVYTDTPNGYSKYTQVYCERHQKMHDEIDAKRGLTGSKYEKMTIPEFGLACTNMILQAKKEKAKMTTNPTFPAIRRMSRHTIIDRLEAALGAENVDDKNYEIASLLKILNTESEIYAFVRKIRDENKSGTALNRAAKKALNSVYRY